MVLGFRTAFSFWHLSHTLALLMRHWLSLAALTALSPHSFSPKGHLYGGALVIVLFPRSFAYTHTLFRLSLPLAAAATPTVFQCVRHRVTGSVLAHPSRSIHSSFLLSHLSLHVSIVVLLSVLRLVC